MSMEVFQQKVDAITVRIGETQADIAMWANAEGVTVSVVEKSGANVLAGSLMWEQMEALCAAFSLLKAKV